MNDVIDVKQNKLSDCFSTYSKENSIKITNTLNLKGSYTVFDNWGQEIGQKELAGTTSNVTLNIPGVYFIRIHAEDNFIVKKVIVGSN